ncbi:MAG TPA: OmpH family outer membrane protein [Pyrinomonadaceae bacterium]
MRSMQTVFIAGFLLVLTSFANAQAPAQTAPVKVGVVNSGAFANPTGGITRLVNAIRTLDTEFKPRRDEITQLVSRFDSLQQTPANTPPAQLAARREQAETLQIEIRRKQEDARVAFSKRQTALIDPVQKNIFQALEAFAKQRGIDLLVDVSKFPDGVFLVNQGADLTPAFIRDFNSRNP